MLSCGCGCLCCYWSIHISLTPFPYVIYLGAGGGGMMLMVIITPNEKKTTKSGARSLQLLAQAELVMHLSCDCGLRVSHQDPCPGHTHSEHNPVRKGEGGRATDWWPSTHPRSGGQDLPCDPPEGDPGKEGGTGFRARILWRESTGWGTQGKG